MLEEIGITKLEGDARRHGWLPTFERIHPCLGFGEQLAGVLHVATHAARV